MELVVHPAHLRAAASALAACAARIDAAAAEFGREVHDNVGDLGFKAIPVAGQAAAATEQALQTLRTDVAALARALDALAAGYPSLDRSAVRP